MSALDEDLIKYGLESDVCSMSTICRVHMSTFALMKAKVGKISPRTCSKIARNSQRPLYEGNKKDNVTIIYTPWSNLLKTASMATGQVSFHNPKLTRKIFVPARQNPIVNRLNKTKIEKFPDLRAEKEEYLSKIRREERKRREEKRATEKRERKEREELKWQKEHAYDDLMNEENVQQSSNQNRDESYLDDFM
ncbi:coiled-coil domain-containing protein 25 [Coccidioides immitis H538.4]|uniref:Coiled-coil domain-containing protein 25 n=1 Tax=Coccidioides immitis H538.4 TaxID=396776 RepID=A0A0J8S2I6_COCIT|nr:coiled-coil domain-containing protein 25 [Coccidioides immitis H538.4]